MSQSDLVRFRPQLIAAFDGLIRMLEETEWARKLPRSNYDVPVQQRIRKAS